MILEQLHKLLQAYPELFGILMFLCGAILGHWLSIGRDKRKEFNEVADELHDILSAYGRHTTAYSTRPSDADYTRLRRRMTLLQAWRFDRALASYKKAQDTQDESPNSVGEIIYGDTTELKAAIHNLLLHLNRR